MVNSLKASDVPGAFFSKSVFGGYRTKRKLLRWSVGHRRAQQDRVVTSPGPSPHTGGSGRVDDPLTRTVGASTGREPVGDASRICAAPLRAHGASTQQPPRG